MTMKTETIISDLSKQPEIRNSPQNHRLYRMVLILVGLVTLSVNLYATCVFDHRCRELQCIGLIWFYSGDITSALGFIPAVYFWPGFAESRIGKHPFVLKGSYVLSIALILFSWFVTLTSYDYWT